MKHAIEPGAKTAAAKKSWVPTRKWAVLVISSLGTIATSTVVTGFGQDEQLALITLFVSAGTTYFIPNSPDNTNSP